MHKCLCARIHTHTHKGKIRMLKNKRSFTGEPNGLVLSSEQFYNIPWPCGILDWLWFHSSYWLGKRSNLKASNDSTLANTWMRLLSWWSGCFPEQDREGVRVPCSLKCLESRLEISSLLFLNILPNHQKWSLYSEKKMTCYQIKNAKLLLHLTKMTSVSHDTGGMGCSGVLELFQLVMVALLLGLSILSWVNMVAVSKLHTLVSLLLNGNHTHSHVSVSPPDLCKKVCAKSIADRLTHRKA